MKINHYGLEFQNTCIKNLNLYLILIQAGITFHLCEGNQNGHKGIAVIPT